MSDAVLQTFGLHKAFGALQATNDVSLDLRAGEIHAIIGPNGAGKSTLIAQLCGALKPDAGQVHLNGEDVTQTSTYQRARLGLARTFQITALAMEHTVLENTLLSSASQAGQGWRMWRAVQRSTEIKDRAFEALSRVGLDEVAQTGCSDVSHGQRRRLEVAVALTLSPKAFVMDEPMAGLGAEGSREMTELLNGLRNEAPILLVEHDMDAVFALADRISVLVSGEIVATGTPTEIRTNAEARAAYLGDAV